MSLIIAICSDSGKVSGIVPKTFRDAPFLLIVDAEQGKVIEILAREDSANLAFAEAVVARHCEALITGPMEKEPFEIVAGANVTRYDGSGRKVERAWHYMQTGRLGWIRDYIGGPGPAAHPHAESCEHDRGEEEEDIPPVFDAVITSAGMSSRMGDFKPLMELGGVPNLVREIQTLREGGVRRIMVVTGNRGEEIRAAVQQEFPGDPNIAFAENPDYRNNEMIDSADAGLREVLQIPEPENGAERGIFLLPVDCPLFTAFSLDELEDRFIQSGADLIVPIFQDQEGHPVLIRSTAVPAVLAADRSEGLRSAFRTAAIRREKVDVPDRGIILDADTPNEYRVLQEELADRRVPSDETCHRLQEWAGTDPSIIEHEKAVCQLADEIAAACSASPDVHPEMVHAAALLHDILKSMDRHPQRAQAFLTRMGSPEIGEIIGKHQDIPEEDLQKISDAVILHASDKLVEGSRRVTMEERFEVRRKRFENNPPALRTWEKRRKMAERAIALCHEAGWNG